MFARVTKEGAVMELTLGTFNLQSTKPNDSVAQAGLLKANGVEVCALQEVNRDSHRFGDEPFDGMKGFIEGDHAFAGHGFAQAIEFAGGSMGVGAVSDLTVRCSSVIALYSEDAMPETSEQMHRYYREYDFTKPQTIANLEAFGRSATYIEPRVALRLEVEVDNRSLAFYSTHLSFETEQLRHTQLVQLRELMRNDTADYVVLAGDLNTDQNTRELDFLRSDFTLANGHDGIWYDTFPERGEGMNVYSIDNLVMSKNMTLLKTWVVHTDLSDHDLLAARVALE
jgi:endonuclease/exonuclease/phosphatase family metal-dependent hydrolase